MATLKQIAIFAKLADTGNMSEAANALALTQPALSQQLRTLETGLGLKLFERVPKGMQLTPAGRDLLSAARNVQNAVRDFDDAADRAAERFVGSIRFGVTPTLGPYLMPSVIKTLHRRYPGLRLYIREGIPDQQHAELAAGELDMVLSP
ncbi:MAG TPA: DNA-binding transcriptional regulator OxyR, partial [Erythrobacter sp.]|nr:DNA-binding transcriptional regulator OxyR [Erythrobacter sp.]